MRKFLITITGMSLIACAYTPGSVQLHDSKTEGIKELSVTPGWLPGSQIKLGVFTNNKMNKNEAVLIVQAKLNTIASKNGLLINIDGEKTYFNSIDKLSEPIENGYFQKRFDVTIDYLKKMVEGKSVWVRVNHNGSTYEEGEFSKGGFTTAKDGFTEFLKRIYSQQVSQK